MKLVVIAQAPARPEEAAQALAQGAGLVLAEARMRLAPEPPALVARLEPEKADALAAALRKAGLAALSMDSHAPSDRDRLVAHLVAFGAEGATFTSRTGTVMEVAWPDFLAILRGVRASRSETRQTERSRSLSLGMALATGGAILTRKTEKTVRSAAESIEQVILVHARDGRSAIIAGGEIDFACLGAALQPSATANMVELGRRLREGAKAAFYDERLLRLGRRPLPFIADVAWSSQTSAGVTRRSDTSETLDVLAEAMRLALVAGLMP